jgi:transglutaminase-like putative cysteine protease
VSSRLVFDAHEPAEAILQVAVSGLAPATVEESLLVLADGVPVTPAEVAMPHGGRAHIFNAVPGRITVSYSAVVTGDAAELPVTDADRVIYLRPSRYSESDRLAPMAQSEFAGIDGAAELLAAVSSWVGSRLSYVPGSSGPTDGAVDTLLQRQGVCRDYAHLVVALLRALDVPARLAAVYAPGLNPMDFHAVAEAAIGGNWRVVDATLLAPRPSLVRIATGRDAADTAFLSTYGGAVELLEAQIGAVIDGPLPGDDIEVLQSIS